jgi:hypothetical protein
MSKAPILELTAAQARQILAEVVWAVGQWGLEALSPNVGLHQKEIDDCKLAFDHHSYR